MDIDLNYVKKGEGETLILLHGNGEDLSYFVHQIDFFSQYFTVYALDSRSHGSSDRGEGELTLDRMSDDLYAFCVSHDISRANILGFSDGANIALLFAIKHPKMVERLVLNGGNLFPMGLKPNVLNEIASDYYRIKDKPERIREKELLRLMLYEPNIKPDALKSIMVPALVVVGKDDMIRRKHSKLIASSLQNGKMIELEGNHFVAYDNPVAFNKTVIDFLLDKDC